MTNEQLTKTLRSARLAYQDGDNKTQFAKLIGISRQTLDAIENAQQIQNVSFKHILKYAEIVGLELKLIKSINEVQGVQNESATEYDLLNGDALQLLNGENVKLK
jgi:DNA-binding XRE family transcriptional regulator